MTIESVRRERARGWRLPVLWVYFGLYALWAVGMLTGLIARGAANDLVFLPLYFAAGLACWHGARAHAASSGTATGWRLVGAAWLVSGVAATMMLVEWWWSHAWLHTTALALYQVYFVLLLLGFWRLLRLPRGASARARLAVDGAIVVVATAILAWYWVFRFDLASQSLLAYLKILFVMFPGELAVALGAVCIAHQPAEASARRALSFLSVATIAAVVADFIYEYHWLVRSSWSGPVGDLVLGLAAVLVATAGLSSPRASGRSAISVGLALVPYLATALVGALAICEWWLPDREHPALAGLVLGGAILMGLLILRLAVAQKEFAREASARAAQDARFRALVQQSSDAILLVSGEGLIQYASPSFGAIIGVPGAGCTGRRLDTLATFDAPGGLAAWLAQPASRPLVRWTVAGREIEATATDHTADPAVGGIVINARDVSERARLEAQLQQAQKMEAVGRFASSVAHDFNNVLTVISGNLELLRGGAPVSTGAEELDQMRAAAERGAALARQLTALSRPKTAAVATVDLAAELRAIAGTLRVLLPSSIQSTLSIPEESIVVGLDEVQTEQILLNLALNSRDAMPGGGTLGVCLEALGPAPGLPPGPGNGWARLTVSDSGTGMSPEVMAKAFEPFFSTKDPARGTGLGLASVQEIVVAAGGRVELDSWPGVGTRVSIFLPLIPAPPGVGSSRQSTGLAEGAGRLLIVDDESGVRLVVARYLERVGYQVEEREDGVTALAYLEDHAASVQLVLTDLVMPRLGGVELAARIAERWPHIRVLVMSGTPGVMRGRAGSGEPPRMITKPIQLGELAERIAETLRTETV